MENYEQKYKEALERARQVHLTNVDANKKSTEYIFPELKESEDEQIRKEILQSIQNNMCVIHKDKCIAWLEKQKERGPLSKDEEYSLARIIEYIEDNGCPSKWKDLLYDVYALPYQKERKPAGWSEEDEYTLESIIKEIEVNKDDAPDYDLATYDRFLSWLISLKQRMKGETK